MPVCRYLRFAWLALLLAAVWPSLLCAQLPKRLEQCLPYPTLAQEISAMYGETEEVQYDESPDAEGIISSVKFNYEGHVSESVHKQLVYLLKFRRFPYFALPEWWDELRDVGIKGALQDAGYFRPYIKLDPQLVNGDQRLKRYSLAVYIEPGRQYRLGEIRFANADVNRPLAFSLSELREHFHMRRGDLFNVSKIRAGINEVTALYGSKGYIDANVVPETENGDDFGPMDLVMKIDEEKQYRVGKIEFLGLNEKEQSQLTPKLKPGDIFPKEFVEQILKRNRSLLPADTSWKDVSISRNTKYGIVDVRFDFYRCSEFKQ
jgi:surface antigen-like variable number repeat protein